MVGLVYLIYCWSIKLSTKKEVKKGVNETEAVSICHHARYTHLLTLENPPGSCNRSLYSSYPTDMVVS